jgi:hypothetical protein
MLESTQLVRLLPPESVGTFSICVDQMPPPAGDHDCALRVQMSREIAEMTDLVRCAKIVRTRSHAH